MREKAWRHGRTLYPILFSQTGRRTAKALLPTGDGVDSLANQQTLEIDRPVGTRPRYEVVSPDRYLPEGMSLEVISWLYRLALPVMFAIGGYVQVKKAVLAKVGRTPQVNCWLVDGLSPTTRRVVEGAARWPALDATYNFRAGVGGNALVRFLDSLWLHVRNAQAVRNRLKIAKGALAAEIRSIAERSSRPVRLLSLAAGTAQGVIEVIADLRISGIAVEAVLIDQDPSALEYARRLASEHRVPEAITTIQGDVLFFDRLLQGFAPDLIEMLGLMDYLPTKLAVSLVRKIHRLLPAGGSFLTCHVHPNAETYFLRHAVNWDMLYRTREAFAQIVIGGGFLTPRLITEPHDIHSIAVARKVTS